MNLRLRAIVGLIDRGLKALGRLPAAQGISAMNAINKAAPAPLFMLALFGTGAVGIALSALAVGHPDQRWAVFTSPTTTLSPLEWERGVAPGFPAAELGAQARYCCLSAI